MPGRKREKTPKQRRLHIRLYLAAAVQFLCSVVMLIGRTDCVPGAVYDAGMLTLLPFGAICLVSADYVKEHRNKYADYGSLKLRQALPKHGNLFVLFAVFFTLSVSLSVLEVRILAGILYLPAMGFLTAGIVAAVRYRLHVRKTAKRSAKTPKTPLERRCCSCGVVLNGLPARKVVTLYVGDCCVSCADRIRREQKAGGKTPCTVCGKIRPVGDMIVVDSAFYCEACFRETYRESHGSE